MGRGEMSQEYSDVSANMRHYSELRFKRITVFLVATGALLGAQELQLGTSESSWAFSAVGLFVTISFWIMAVRAAHYYWNFRERAVKLEDKLNYSQYKNLPKRWKITSIAVHLLFAGFMVMWIALFASAIPG